MDNEISDRDWDVFIQATVDATGYPKSDENKKRLGYSSEELNILFDRLISSEEKVLNKKEKQMILNSIDGTLDYVGSDIPSLYDISEQELQDLKKDLEKQWGIVSTYK